MTNSKDWDVPKTDRRGALECKLWAGTDCSAGAAWAGQTIFDSKAIKAPRPLGIKPR